MATQSQIPLEAQRRMWTRWNAAAREQAQGEGPLRQAQVVEGWLSSTGRRDLDIIDVGCGAGWMSERLLTFGRVVGTDIVDEVLRRAQLRCPRVRFVAGDIMSVELPDGSFDAAVSLEVLSHVGDQAAFLARIARLLRPGGQLMLSTQNRPVYERWSVVGAPESGQLRHWVDARELRRLLKPKFELVELTSVCPQGHEGFLRVVNSPKLNRILGMVFGSSRVEHAKERYLLGCTLMALARRRG